MTECNEKMESRRNVKLTTTIRTYGSYVCTFYRSVRPLLNDVEFSNTERIVAEFISDNGVGPKLQHQLLKRYENTDSWVR